MKRIVIVTDILSPYRIPVFEELAKQSELLVLTLSDQDRLRDWGVQKSSTFAHRSLPPLPGSQRLSYGRRPVHLNYGGRRAVMRHRPHLVVVGGWNQPAFLPLLMLNTPCPLALWVESTINDARRGDPRVEAFKRFLLRRADVGIVPGRASKAYMEHLGFSGNIFLAPNAVDVDFFARPRPELDVATSLQARHVLVFVGDPTRAKGIDIALAVVAALPDTGLIVLGDSDERASWERRAAETGIAHRVHFEGFVDAERVAQVLASATLILFPSRSDPWGLVINEAQAAGCPVVSSPVPGAVADLGQEGALQLVPVDEQAWVTAVAQLLASPGRLRQLAAAGREQASRHTAAACASGFVAAAEHVSC